MMRYITTLGIVAVACGIAAHECRAQAADTLVPNDAVPFAPFARPSHFWIGWPKGAMYEGDVLIPVYLWSRTSNIARVSAGVPTLNSGDCMPKKVATVIEILTVPHFELNEPEKDAKGQSREAKGCTLILTPRFTIRQQKGGSSPVRTPTFNPMVEFNRHRLEFRVANDQSILPHADLETTFFRIGHYSNGQAGCLYANQTYDAAGKTCLPQVFTDTLNTTDGSFSTHYIELGSTVSTIDFDATGLERHLFASTISGRWNPGGYIAKGGGMDAGLAATYGRVSIDGGLTVRKRSGDLRGWSGRQWEVALDGEWAFPRSSPYGIFRTSAEASMTIPQMYGFGIAARYVRGWDYYNVAYGHLMTNPKQRVTFGIILDHSRPFTISREARKRAARGQKDS